jgi:hypothetical protein
MSLSDMKVFNDFAYLAATETVDQQVALFNEASAGTITLTSARNVGDYTQEAMYQNITGLARYRDAYGSGTVAATALAQLQLNSVKVAAGSPPVSFERQALTHLQRNPEEAATMIGIQWGKAQFQQQLNAAIGAAVGATTANTALVHTDQTGAANFKKLNRAAQKFGDRATDIRAWIIHGTEIHELYDNALTNTEELFRFGDVGVVGDAFGRRFIITDAPGLYKGDATVGYRTLGLVQGAVMVSDNSDLNFNVSTLNGTENVVTTWQAEYTFQVAVKGYSWNTAWNGETAATPVLADLSAGANWPQGATSDKDCAGVMLLAGVPA